MNAPVRARPLGPSAMREDEADEYPEGSVTVATLVRVKTPFERVARAVLSENREERNQLNRRGEPPSPPFLPAFQYSQAIDRADVPPQV